MSLEYPAKIALLRDRAEMLAKARAFFMKRDICEVDCPILTKAASIDAHIDLIPATFGSKEKRYLHSSPEYGMKRLLAQGMGNIFQLSHVFRDGEYGIKHNPEFMMAEWYHIGISFSEMIEETIQFVHLFLGELSFRVLSYRETFLHYAGIDYLKISAKELIKFLETNGIEIYPQIQKENKDELLNLVLGLLIEPQLGQDELFVLAYYPSSQAALAQIQWRGNEPVAERFEIYYRGMELANGYHELTHAEEQRKRFIEANHQRASLGKEILPIDEAFLEALSKGLPDCCGVAVGFDRLMMLRQTKQNIGDVVPFGWEVA